VSERAGLSTILVSVSGLLYSVSSHADGGADVRRRGRGNGPWRPVGLLTVVTDPGK